MIAFSRCASSANSALGYHGAMLQSRLGPYALLLGLCLGACDSGSPSSSGADGSSGGGGSTTTAATTDATDATDPATTTDTSTTATETRGPVETSGPSGSTTDPTDTTTTGEPTTGDPIVCGDGVAEGDEECDGADLLAWTCADFGFVAGELTCNDICQLEFDGCENSACGNGTIERKEVCDGAALSEQTCQTLGFDNGELCCANDCTQYDTTGCGSCGDGTVDPAETCEPGDLGGETCAAQGFGGGGTLGCNADCLGFDTTACISDCCIPGGANDPGCQVPSIEMCVCEFDPFCCNTDWDGQCVAGAINVCGAVCGECGNGVIEPAESCDGANLGGQTCGSQGFDGGTLSCAGNCQSFNTSNCIDIPSWSSQIHPIFTANCGCHGAGFPPWASNPTASVAYDLIVGVAGGGGVQYINAGNPNASLIVQRVESAVAPMPPAPAMPLSIAQQQLIRAWVQAGAPEN